MKHLKIVSFTARGAALAQRIAIADCLTERYARSEDESLRSTALSRFAQQAMVDCDAILFVGAAGIAVRAVAPYLAGKAVDPAVLVMDEAGKFIIPLLSGHLGGANALAEEIARTVGATAVITTATDVRRVFAVDSWAKANGFLVLEPQEIRYLSAALLRGEAIGFQTPFPLCEPLPEGVENTVPALCGAVLSFDSSQKPFAHTLHLVPRGVVAGIGCRRGKSAEEIERQLRLALCAAGVDARALSALATIDRKGDEIGLNALAARLSLPLLTFSAAELTEVEGEFTSSDFVRQTVGVENVCERAAARASGGTRLCPKTAENGVTIALYAKIPEVVF